MTAPFQVGDRVRMGEESRRLYGLRKATGTVLAVAPERILVSRDLHRPDSRWWHPDHWEPIPVNDMTLDETCAQLFAAYHAGQPDAALALAERIFELLGGTKAATR